MQMNKLLPVVGGFVLLCATFPALAGDPPALPTASGTTGGAVTQITVSGGTRALFKIALPTPTVGETDLSKSIVETETRDFTNSSIFQVLDSASFTANLAAEGNSIEPSSWRSVGAEGVVKASTSTRSGGIHVDFALYVVSRGRDAVLKKDYDVPKENIRSATHQFCNEVVKYFTGTAGSFGTRMVFSATTGRGQKGIYQIESDGQGLSKLTAATNVALAPAIGSGSIYYAGGLPDGSYALFKIGNPAAVLKHAGMIFGASFGGGKIALVISQAGQSDIWTGNPDGTNLTKVTSGGLNTHPAFGPQGQLAYVSNASGSPQIYVGGKAVSSRGNYNMAPVWCPDPDGLKILFMGRDGASWDVFSVAPSGDPATMKRLTQSQESNTYPACAPDGRTIAFFSTRGGLYTANPAGLNQQKINSVQGESLRWEGN